MFQDEDINIFKVEQNYGTHKTCIRGEFLVIPDKPWEKYNRGQSIENVNYINSNEYSEHQL